MVGKLLTFPNTAKISLNLNMNSQNGSGFKNNNMNATIGYFIGFALGCIAMFIAIKLDFSSIAKMILVLITMIAYTFLMKPTQDVSFLEKELQVY